MPSISLVEYSCPINNRGVQITEIHRDTTKVHKLKLAVAMARTILNNPFKISYLMYQAGSSLLFLKYVIAKDSHLSLIDDANNLFRDFSRSSRVGEMAQGITFLFALDFLRFPIFIDFKDFLHSQGLPEPKHMESTPDFVMYDPSGLDIFVVEVKGRWPKKVDLVELKSKFSGALKQCKSGEGYFHSRGLSSPIKGNYAIVVDLFEKSNHNNSTLRISDPESIPMGLVEDPNALIKRQYVSWFLMLGHVQTAIRLYNGLEIGYIPTKELYINGELFYILDHGKSDIDNLFTHILGGSYTYAISSEVWSLLNTQSIRNTQFHFNFKPLKNRGYHLFLDGTLLIEEQIIKKSKIQVTEEISLMDNESEQS